MASIHSFKKTRNNLYEKQKLRNIYMLIFLLLVEAACLYYCILKILAHKPFILSTFNYWPMVIFTLLIPTPLLLVYVLTQLETIFNDDGIFYRWMPFSKKYKMIQWDAIREISLVDLSKEGFMWRFSNKYDSVNYLGSGFGVFILMKSGRKRLLSTRKPEALNRILTRLAGPHYKPSSIVERHDYSDD